jgi:cysteine-rich repeat protein
MRKIPSQRSLWSGGLLTAAWLATFISAGCVDLDVPFQCREDGQCLLAGTKGACEQNGSCSFPDGTCASGRRYGHHARPPSADRCVECGNGVLESNEQCDDGNLVDSDACRNTCHWARCGDGVVRAGVEECDTPRGGAAGDCSPLCVRCMQGDARFIWSGNGHCYARYDETLSWTAARDSCGDAGGHLVAYTGNYENQEVHDTLLDGSDAKIWIGLHDAAGNDTFVWQSGESVVVRNWGENEPSSSAEDCVFQQSSSPNGASGVPGAWGDFTCSNALAYLCEFAGWVVRPTNGHAYRGFFRPRSWEMARAACASAGGYLATITSAEEDAFIAAQFPGGSWLGATDSAVEGTYAWVTNEPLAYTNYAPNEPDDPMGDHDCLLLGPDNVWHDRACSTENRYICERE